MTVDELRAILESESGFKLNKLRTIHNTVAKDTAELCTSNPRGYRGVAKVSGAPVQVLWELVEREGDWYYSAEALD